MIADILFMYLLHILPDISTHDKEVLHSQIGQSNAHLLVEILIVLFPQCATSGTLAQ